jgi:hypothetical protein
MNTTRRVSFRGGWIGLFSGESQGKALERELTRLNADGYKVAFVVDDRWSIFARAFWLLVFIFTLGIVGKSPNLLIVGERMDQAAAAAAPAQPTMSTYAVERGA